MFEIVVTLTASLALVSHIAQPTISRWWSKQVSPLSQVVHNQEVVDCKRDMGHDRVEIIGVALGSHGVRALLTSPRWKI